MAKEVGCRSALNGATRELSSHRRPFNFLSLRDLSLLCLLAAFWGGAFIAVRFTVPETGALFTASLRIIVAAFALVAYAHVKKISLNLVKNIKSYTLCGLFGAAFPFFLVSYAAPFLPAATSAFFNATSPLFCLLFSSVFFSELITLRKLTGLGIGLAGVFILVGFESLWRVHTPPLAILASLLAPASFAVSAIAIKQFTHSRLHQSANQTLVDSNSVNSRLVNSASVNSKSIDPIALATGSMVVAAVVLLPEFICSLPSQVPSHSTLLSIVLMGLLPSAFAQIIFVPLVARMGAVCAMSVSFLIPLFSILWAYLFLGEGIHSSMISGGLLVLTATALILWR